MSDIALSAARAHNGKRVGQFVVAGMIVATAVILLFPDALSALAKYPDGLIIPFKDWVGAFMAWLKTNFTWATRSLAAVRRATPDLPSNLLAKGIQVGNGEAWPGPCRGCRGLA